MVAPEVAPSEGAAKEVVRRGWDRVSTIYRPPVSTLDAFGHSFLDYEDWLHPLIHQLPRHSAVLDLGCGCGIPVARELSQHFQVTGVDISDVQINRARQLVPNARFLPADMTRIQFPSEVFAGITCLYALIHVPLPEQRTLLGRVYRLARPGGARAGDDGGDGLDRHRGELARFGRPDVLEPRGFRKLRPMAP